MEQCSYDADNGDGRISSKEREENVLNWKKKPTKSNDTFLLEFNMVLSSVWIWFEKCVTHSMREKEKNYYPIGASQFHLNTK